MNTISLPFCLRGEGAGGARVDPLLHRDGLGREGLCSVAGAVPAAGWPEPKAGLNHADTPRTGAFLQALLWLQTVVFRTYFLVSCCYKNVSQKGSPQHCWVISNKFSLSFYRHHLVSPVSPVLYQALKSQRPITRSRTPWAHHGRQRPSWRCPHLAGAGQCPLDGWGGLRAASSERAVSACTGSKIHVLTQAPICLMLPLNLWSDTFSDIQPSFHSQDQPYLFKSNQYMKIKSMCIFTVFKFLLTMYLQFFNILFNVFRLWSQIKLTCNFLSLYRPWPVLVSRHYS